MVKLNRGRELYLDHNKIKGDKNMIIVDCKKVNITKFPNNEVLIKGDQFWKKSGQTSYIRFKFENNEDLINLMFIKKHLDEMGVKSILTILYMPYSRMDRTEGQTVFTLKYICKFINDLNFDKVEVHEPHSDVTLALLDRATAVNMTQILTTEAIRMLDFNEENDDYLFYPDSGAEKRYGKQIKWDKILTGSKERDFKTGWIKKLDVVGEVPKNPFRAIIVDDLCSKGGTFMMSAKKLRDLGATEVYLVVTHCENSIYDGDILKTDLIDKVFTTTSILDNIDNDKIKMIINSAWSSDYEEVYEFSK